MSVKVWGDEYYQDAEGLDDDLLYAGCKDAYSDTTSPNAKYMTGADSCLTIVKISDVGTSMSFVIGDGPAATMAPAPEPTPVPTVGPTLEPTPLPIIKVQYKCAETGVSVNQIKPYFNIVNSTGSSVDLKELAVRY